jgi:hypothetical protein
VAAPRGPPTLEYTVQLSLSFGDEAEKEAAKNIAVEEVA